MSSLNLLVSSFVVVTVVLHCAVTKHTKTPPNGKPGLSVAVLKNLDAVHQAMQARGQSMQARGQSMQARGQSNDGENDFGGPSVEGHFPPPSHCIPPELFNQNVSEIFFNQSLTRAEVKQELDAWAAAQNATVKADYAEFTANQTECITEMKAAINAAVAESNLSTAARSAVTQIQAVFANDSLTRMQTMQGVMAIFQALNSSDQRALFILRQSVNVSGLSCCFGPGGGPPGFGGSPFGDGGTHGSFGGPMFGEDGGNGEENDDGNDSMGGNNWDNIAISHNSASGNTKQKQSPAHTSMIHTMAALQTPASGTQPNFQNVPPELQGAAAIFFNLTLTKAQRQQQLNAWVAAQNASVQAEYNAIAANISSQFKAAAAAFNATLATLSPAAQNAVAQIRDVFQNSNLTWTQASTAVKNIVSGLGQSDKKALWQALISAIGLNGTDSADAQKQLASFFG